MGHCHFVPKIVERLQPSPPGSALLKCGRYSCNTSLWTDLQPCPTVIKMIPISLAHNIIFFFSLRVWKKFISGYFSMYTSYLHVSVFTILSRFPHTHTKKSICISKKPAQDKCLKYAREIISVNKTKYFKPKLGSKFCLHLPKPPAAFYLLFSLHFNYRYVPLNDWPVLHSRAVFKFMAFLFLMRICGLDLPLITQ